MKETADSGYSPKQLSRFREMRRELDKYNDQLEQWNDENEGRSQKDRSPRPPAPGYSSEEMGELAEYHARQIAEKLGRPLRPESTTNY